MFGNFFSSPAAAATSVPAGQPTLPPVVPPPPMTADELARHVAASVDAARARVVRDETRAKVLERKPSYNPKIRPTDDAWKEVKNSILDRLQRTNISSILHDKQNYCFVIPQDELLLAPFPEGTIFKIQERDRIKYAANIGPGGTFEGEHDNMATKLTMLHFGLPIAPASMNNITRSGFDEDDAPDDPADRPRIQKIFFAEKPLEFLDLYHSRSFGFSMYRRPLPRRSNRSNFLMRKEAPLGPLVPDDPAYENPPIPLSGDAVSIRGGAVRRIVDDDEDQEESQDSESAIGYYLGDIRSSGAMEPAGDVLTMRGGAGSPDDDDEEEEEEEEGFWLYYEDESEDSVLKVRLETSVEGAPVSEKSFLDRALALLKLDPKQPYDFHLHQYRIEKPYKGGRSKAWVATFPMNDANAANQYERFIEPRLYQNSYWLFLVGTVEDSPPEVIDIQKYTETDFPSLLKKQRKFLRKQKAAAQPFSTKEIQAQRAAIIGQLPAPKSKTKTPQPTKTPDFAPTSTKKGQSGKRPASEANPVEPRKKQKTKIAKASNDDIGSQKATTDMSVAGTGETELLGDWQVIYVNPATDARTKEFFTGDEPSFMRALGRCGRTWGYPLHLSYYRVPTPASYGQIIRTLRIASAKQFDDDILRKIATFKAPIFVVHESWEAPTGQVWPLDINRGWIYGYAGKVQSYLVEEDIEIKVRLLLGLTEPDYNFYVDIYPPNDAGPSVALAAVETVLVTRANFSQRFDRYIRRALMQAGPNNWGLFFRKTTTPKPTMLEPPPDQSKVVRIENCKAFEPAAAGQWTLPAVGYWKLPDDVEIHNHGLNRYQPEFFRAMKVLYPTDRPFLDKYTPMTEEVMPTDRPNAELSFDNLSMGPGAMEVHPNLLDKVRAMLGKANARKAAPFEPPTLEVDYAYLDPEIGVRMCGNQHRGTFGDELDSSYSRPLLEGKIYDEVVRMSDLLGAYSPRGRPKNFRLWATASDRENNGPSVVIPYEPRREAIDEIRYFLPENSDSSLRRSLKTTCVWFRPEWLKLDFTLLHDPKGIIHTWTVPEDNTKLASFKKFAAQQLRLTIAENGNICEILDTRHGIQSWSSYLVNSDDDEDSFRRDVFDWFQSSSLDVRGNGEDIDVILDDSVFWGSAQAMSDILDSKTQGGIAPASSAGTKNPRTSTNSGNSTGQRNAGTQRNAIIGRNATIQRNQAAQGDLLTSGPHQNIRSSGNFTNPRKLTSQESMPGSRNIPTPSLTPSPISETSSTQGTLTTTGNTTQGASTTQRNPTSQGNASNTGNSTQGTSTAQGNPRTQPRAPSPTMPAQNPGPNTVTLIPQPPRVINKERLLRPYVTKPVPPKYDSYVIEQNRLNQLQKQSYYRSQSVVEPGQKPDAPYFGQTQELMLTIGSSTPTVYAQRLTPTDIAQIVDENQELRNQVLDRRDKCELCGMTFVTYSNEDKRKHWADHIEHFRIAGNCPICNDDKWVFMDTAQRRQHLWDHQHAHESDVIKSFWGDFECPVCDQNLKDETTDYIISHMLDHQPGQLIFCDRCGIDKGSLKDVELDHHKKVCDEGNTQEAVEALGPQFGLVFCGRCGNNRTFETAEELEAHRASCSDTKAPNHCIKCGFNYTLLSTKDPNGRQRHNDLCQPPLGWKKKFCRRCRKNLSEMTEAGYAIHKQECFSREDADLYTLAVQENKKRDAKIRKEEDLRAQNRAIESRQQIAARDLAEREAELAKKTATFDASARNSQSLTLASNTYKALFSNTLDKCPIYGCAEDTVTLSSMDKGQLVDHIKSHNVKVTFKCPLDHVDSNGSMCQRRIEVGTNQNPNSIKAHYMHTEQVGAPVVVTEPPVDVGVDATIKKRAKKLAAAKTRADEDFGEASLDLNDLVNKDGKASTASPAKVNKRKVAPVEPETSSATKRLKKTGTVPDSSSNMTGTAAASSALPTGTTTTKPPKKKAILIPQNLTGSVTAFPVSPKKRKDVQAETETTTTKRLPRVASSSSGSMMGSGTIGSASGLATAPTPSNKQQTLAAKKRQAERADRGSPSPSPAKRVKGIAGPSSTPAKARDTAQTPAKTPSTKRTTRATSAETPARRVGRPRRL